MKQYIERNDMVLTCNHPAVEKFWQYGGMMAQPNSPIYEYVGIVLKNGERKEFGGDQQFIDTMIQCNNFLNTIPE